MCWVIMLGRRARRIQQPGICVLNIRGLNILPHHPADPGNATYLGPGENFGQMKCFFPQMSLDDQCAVHPSQQSHNKDCCMAANAIIIMHPSSADMVSHSGIWCLLDCWQSHTIAHLGGVGVCRDYCNECLPSSYQKSIGRTFAHIHESSIIRVCEYHRICS